MRHDRMLIGDKGQTQKVFSLDNPSWASVEIKWHSEAPEYLSDFNVYVWQPHFEAPKEERATIFVDKTSEDDWKVLISWDLREKSSAILPDLYLQELEKQLSTRFDAPYNNRTRIFSCFLSIFILLIRDTHIFLDDMLDLISRLVGSR